MQGVWSDMHTRLIAYACDALGAELPDDLTARAEEAVSLTGPLQDDETRRADVGVVSDDQSWKRGEPAVWTPEGRPELAERVAVPVVVLAAPPTPRWVEIRTGSGTLITVIEVTSRSNKSKAGRPTFEAKVGRFLDGGASVMEIDLIRDGTAARHTRMLQGWPQEPCQVIVDRAYRRDAVEVYPCPLRDPLPVVRVPLRRREPDAALDLQELVDQCYARGRYWKLPYDSDPIPPLDEADLAWARERLK
ncbi:hypothetical protein BH23VER1_BH23VER1_09010 [soil metagenome]